MPLALDFGISKELERVEQRIAECLKSNEDLLTEIASYVVRSGGKRIRPIITLIAFYAAGGEEPSEAIEMASAIELIHNATLVHDDINDGGTLRRGMESAYEKFGVGTSLVAGDYLFARGFEIGGRFSDKVVGVTARACVNLAEGEIRQMRNLRNVDLRAEEYIDTVTMKTAMPMSSGAKVGAILGRGTDAQVEALADYGLNLGICFQIVDDILDVIGTEAVLGKPVGTDIREGNLTLIPIFALRNGSEEADALRAILRKEEKTESDVAEALRLLKESGAVEQAREAAGEYSRTAKKHLSVPLIEEFKEELVKLADFVLERSY
ncbi:MAG: polyprenyl synthetase family protein [Candidatus Thermoplasmatota archaeon]|nr:polyprenyl synthetase family protein [Candidatus Thermoplasmatota archaeon]